MDVGYIHIAYLNASLQVMDHILDHSVISLIFPLPGTIRLSHLMHAFFP